MLALVVAAVAVGLDNFGAAIGLGLLPGGRRRWEVAVVFGCFEAGMPVAGIAVGRSVSSSLSAAAPIAGGVVLAVMGVYSVARAVIVTRREQAAPEGTGAPTGAVRATDPAPPQGASATGSLERRRRAGRGGLGKLLVLGAVLSIDNLVVGFALGTYHVGIAVAAIVIGAVSVGLSLLGLELGGRLGERIGERSELIGGLALVAVGVMVAAGVH